MTPPVDPWLSPKQAAQEVQVNKETIYRACRGKSLRASKVGRFWKIKRSHLDAWLETGAAA